MTNVKRLFSASQFPRSRATRLNIMPAALQIDREAVRVLVVAIGPRAAARELGLPEDTVLAWSARYGWVQKAKELQVITAARVREREESRGIVQASAIKAPAEALASVLADHERQTKLSLARTARNNAAEAELAGLDGADKALQTGKLAALVHGWQQGPGTTVQVAVELRMDME